MVWILSLYWSPPAWRKVAHGWVLQVDAHEPSLVDVLVCDRIEGLEEVVANECQHPCSLPGVV